MKRVGLILSVLLLMILPIKVSAANVTTEISGIANAKPGDTVTYDVKITTVDETKAAGYQATVNYNKEVLELKSITSKDWTGTSTNDNFNFTYKDGISGSSIVATITFKVKADVPKQSTVISLKDIKITILDDDGQSIVTVNDDSPAVRASLSIKSTDNTLKDLKIDGNTIEGFKSDVVEYTIDVKADTSSIELTAVPNNANAKFQEGFGSRKVDLDYGKNELLIKVEAESGEVKEYKLIINREDDRNTNNDLKEVIINSGKLKINLSKNRVDYTIKTYKLKKIEIDAVSVDPKAKVDVKIPNEIIIGDNVVVITVTSEAGEEKVYTITFENSDEAVDTKIKTLFVSGINLDFDKNTMVYKVVYNKKYRQGLNIKVVTVSGDELVYYEIYYNGQLINEDTKIELAPGDKYEIKVYPLGMEEGDESEATTYTIEIVKDKRINFFFLLDLVILLVLIILLIVQFIQRKKILNGEPTKNKNNKKKQTTKKETSSDQVSNKTKVLSDEELKQINQNSKKIDI